MKCFFFRFTVIMVSSVYFVLAVPVAAQEEFAKRRVWWRTDRGVAATSCENSWSNEVSWACCDGTDSVDIADWGSGHTIWYEAKNVCEEKGKHMCSPAELEKDGWFKKHDGFQVWTKEACDDSQEEEEPMELQTDCLVYIEKLNRVVVDHVNSEVARQYLNVGDILEEERCANDLPGLVLCRAAPGQAFEETPFMDPHEVNGLWGKHGTPGYFCLPTWKDWTHIKSMMAKAEAALTRRVARRKIDGQWQKSCESTASEVHSACCDDLEQIDIGGRKSWLLAKNRCAEMGKHMCSPEELANKNRRMSSHWFWTAEECYAEDEEKSEELSEELKSKVEELLSKEEELNSKEEELNSREAELDSKKEELIREALRIKELMREEEESEGQPDKPTPYWVIRTGACSATCGTATKSYEFECLPSGDSAACAGIEKPLMTSEAIQCQLEQCPAPKKKKMCRKRKCCMSKNAFES